MYKYKRGIKSIDSAKQVEYIMSDNKNTCFSMSANLANNKPYNGMYIQNGKVMLLNLLEKFEIRDKVYNMSQLTTTVKEISCDEYIDEIDLEQSSFEYNFSSINLQKKIIFDTDKKILCVEYNISNNEDSKVIFTVSPLVTYRPIFSMRTSNLLRFNQRKVDRGVMVNLSVLDQINLVLKSKDLDYLQEQINITNIKHDYIDKDGNRQTFTEDVVVPGNFDVVLKPFEKKIISIYISDYDFDIDTLDNNTIFSSYDYSRQKVASAVKDEYVELKELTKTMEYLNMQDLLIASMPYDIDYEHVFENDILKDIKKLKKYILDLTNIVRAIDGRYLVFKKLKEAAIVLEKVKECISKIDELNNISDENILLFVNLKLWYIEIMNRLIQASNTYDMYFDFTKNTLYYIFDNAEDKHLLDYIKTVALTYNAIKIYENMLSHQMVTDSKMYKFKEDLNRYIEEKFWVEGRRTMKRNVNDKEAFANIDMIYTLSLSYPCIIGNMPIKLLDTIFKELYTPYGLRVVPKLHEESTGNIYPKYMAHFVKANLRQNGVTRASQKIAYNLVKELIQDINKYVNGGIKKVYNEKGIAIDTIAYDLLTNAEIIRLYDMLT